MVSENKKDLLEKYWKGETTVAEENWLRQHLKDLPNADDPEAEQLFKQLDQFAELSLDPAFGENFMDSVAEPTTKIIPIWKRFYSIAAGLVLLIGCCFVISIYLQPAPAPVLAAEEDPEKAYQMATEALLLMSSKLNTASEYTAELSRFNDAAEIIKNEQ